MLTWFRPIAKFLKATPNRTFIIYPLLTLLVEYLVRDGKVVIEPYYLILMVWGYGQYRFCGQYRVQVGGGGPGLEKPPERLVTSGIYGYTRNPMYLGHLIFLLGLTLALRSIFAAVITVATAIWFQSRVVGDERRLIDLFGTPYVDYLKRVKRWIPGVI